MVLGHHAVGKPNIDDLRFMIAIFNLMLFSLSFIQREIVMKNSKGFFNGKFEVSKGGLKYLLNLYFLYALYYFMLIHNKLTQ